MESELEPTPRRRARRERAGALSACMACVGLSLARCGSGARPDAGVADASWGAGAPAAPRIPVVSGEFVRVMEPDRGRYLNDHTLVFDPSARRWHVIGITDEGRANPHDETEFLHASAPSLLGPWTIEPDVIPAQRAEGEGVVWAPHVVGAPGAWEMRFYSPRGGIVRARSADLYDWTRDPRWADRASNPPGDRDPHQLILADRRLLYSVGSRVAPEGTYGQIVVTESRDGVTWSPARTALEEPGTSFAWGNLESPCVVSAHGGYYLFVTRTDEGYGTYHRTLVFHSTEPDRFAWRPITELWAHAAEVVQQGTRWYITSAGWTNYTGERWRGLLVAPLQWLRE
jgi:arabinan endo-1,5-alpha-L-arabinosidase